jgi:hypothetical protein
MRFVSDVVAIDRRSPQSLGAINFWVRMSRRVGVDPTFAVREILVPVLE